MSETYTTDSAEALAEALGRHSLLWERRCYPEHACSCGEWDGAQGDDGGPNDGCNDTEEAHRAHVAQALIASGAVRHEAEVRAEALREAADDYLPGHYYEHFRRWLRQRAALAEDGAR